MKEQYDKHKKPAIDYKEGDKVYINAEHLPRTQPSRKLDKKFFGPYEIIEKVGTSAYRIRIPSSWKVYNFFNESLLKPYYAPVYPNQTTNSGGEDEEAPHDITDREYKVEKHLDSRISKKGRGQGKLEYLVKWKNYPVEEASWEMKENLENAQDAISDFHKENPSAPRKVRTMPITKKYENYTKPNVPQTLFGWEDCKLEHDHLDRMENVWEKQKGQGKSIQEWETEDDNKEFMRT